MSVIGNFYEKDLYPELEEAGETERGHEMLDVAALRLARGDISRRTFLTAATAISAFAFLRAAPAHAAGGDVVIANWGGPALDFYKNIYGAPFEEATDYKVVIDGTGPLPAKVKAMVEAKATIWDVFDTDGGKVLVLAKEGLVEPIDYSIVDPAKVPEGTTREFFVPGYYLSNVLTWDTTKVSRAPTGWLDFWNLETFPGMRCVRKTPDAHIEICMVAAGRAPADVYPIDFDVVKSKIAEIKPSLIAWASGAQSQEMFLNGEVVMGDLWHTRTSLLHRETGGKVSWTWNEGVLVTSGWAVPKNNPAGREAAMKLIASMQAPEQQVEMLKAMGNGPVNPAAAALVPDEFKVYDPGQPEAKAVSIPHNPEWWNAPSGKGNLSNDAVAREVWLDALS